MVKKKNPGKQTLPKEVQEYIKSEVKTSGDLENYFREMLKVALEQMLEGELESHLGYEKHKPSGKTSSNSRNGKNTKALKTDLGKIELDVPRDRDSSFDPQIVRKRQRVLDKVEGQIIGLYSKGMSNRDIASQIHELYGIEISDTTISRITDRLMPAISEWQNRPLDPVYLIVWMDALFIKVRSEGRVKNLAVYLAIGLNQEGLKEVLGMWINETEGASFWLQVLSDLQARGVKDILIACIDNLKGFAEAIESTFPRCAIQPCVIHQIRNSLKYVAWKSRRELAKDLQKIYTAPTLAAGEQRLEEFAQNWENSHPLIIKSWRTNWDRISTFFSYPPAIRRIMYTTNTIESLNRNIRKFIKNKATFPSEESARKAVYLAIHETAKKWTHPIRDWDIIISQFAILFEDRIQLKL